ICAAAGFTEASRMLAAGAVTATWAALVTNTRRVLPVLSILLSSDMEHHPNSASPQWACHALGTAGSVPVILAIKSNDLKKLGKSRRKICLQGFGCSSPVLTRSAGHNALLYLAFGPFWHTSCGCKKIGPIPDKFEPG